MSEQTNPIAEEQNPLPEFVALYRRAFADYPHRRCGTCVSSRPPLRQTHSWSPGHSVSRATCRRALWPNRSSRSAVPLSRIQAGILRLLASQRDPESYVAGATPLNRDAARYSRDIDIFHDREERVASAA